MLPVAFIKIHNIAYGQPVLVKPEGECSKSQPASSSSISSRQLTLILCTAAGSKRPFLCSATCATTNGASHVEFDASLLCGLEASNHLDHHQQQQHSLCTVTPLATKVLTAASIKASVRHTLAAHTRQPCMSVLLRNLTAAIIICSLCIRWLYLHSCCRPRCRLRGFSKGWCSRIARSFST